MHSTRQLLIFLALIVLVLVVSVIAGYLFLTPQLRTDIPPGFPQDAPAPAPSDYVAAQQGFQYLVSYDERGFAPITLSIKAGEMVRFTNNARGSARLTLSSQQSQILNHGEYREYTFTEPGSYTYTDGTSAHVGTLTVQ